MNRVLQRASHHGRALGALFSAGVAAFGVYSAGILIYVNDRWRNGTSRVYDHPNWNNVSPERKNYIISNRQCIVKSIHDLYQMDDKRASDGSTVALFTESCVLEDPYYRFVGPKEILRAFANLHRRNKYISFKVYDPTHFEDAIIIKCEREFDRVSSNIYKDSNPQLIRSNLAVHLTVDEKGEEKIDYIADEWNYVSLVQPETHDAFIFAGSVARMLRRVPSMLTHIYLEDNKSLFNPLRLIDAVNECFAYISQKMASEEVEVPEQSLSHPNTTPVNSFNAGVKNS